MVEYTTYDEVKSLRIKENYLDWHNNSEFICIRDNVGKIVSLIQYKINAKCHRLKIQCVYSFPETRCNGYAGVLIQFLIDNYEKLDIYADCLPASISLFSRLGFETYNIKEFKHFTLFYVRLRRDYGKTKD